ncbi:MAG: hypothetical protein JHC73_21280 [Dolichospermum sp.]|nr:hypothetical protein [Dolichospermum sp.]
MPNIIKFFNGTNPQAENQTQKIVEIFQNGKVDNYLHKNPKSRKAYRLEVLVPMENCERPGDFIPDLINVNNHFYVPLSTGETVIYNLQCKPGKPPRYNIDLIVDSETICKMLKGYRFNSFWIILYQVINKVNRLLVCHRISLLILTIILALLRFFF